MITSASEKDILGAKKTINRLKPEFVLLRVFFDIVKEVYCCDTEEEVELVRRKMSLKPGKVEMMRKPWEV